MVARNMRCFDAGSHFVRFPHRQVKTFHKNREMFLQRRLAMRVQRVFFFFTWMNQQINEHVSHLLAEAE